jgi:diadenosine tetraphosphate (Ap4A) HIT family hydrolase
MDDQCSICPFCQGIPGVGPTPVSTPKTPFDVILYETREVVLAPALGMIVPGSLLVISKDHLNSFANFGSQALAELHTDVNRIIQWLQPIFGEYLVFEHGASATQTYPHGGCIIHAHFHLFPTAKETGPMILDAFSWQELKTLAELSNAKDCSYCLLRLAEHYYFSDSPNLPSQWIRRIVVSSITTDRHWDWGVDFGQEELQETLDRLHNHPLQKA